MDCLGSRRQLGVGQRYCVCGRSVHVLCHADRSSIVQGLIGSGMGKGPALALLLAGPALSLPSMLVINSVMGFRKTFVFVSLVCGCRPLQV